MTAVIPSPRAWLKAQSKLARATTLPIVALGLGGTAAAIAQAWCLAWLIGPALLGAAASGLGVWAAGFVVATAVRVGLGVLADLRGFEAGAAARRRLRTGFLVASFAAGPNRGPSTGEAVATAVDQVDALDGYFARWLPVVDAGLGGAFAGGLRGAGG